MLYNSFALFLKSFGRFNREVRAKLLDHWPASSKWSRWDKKGGDEIAISEHVDDLASEE